MTIRQPTLPCAHSLTGGWCWSPPIGTICPHVAILAAVETADPDMMATLDAAALAKMADRGQIIGGLADGPPAFDNLCHKAGTRCDRAPNSDRLRP